MVRQFAFRRLGSRLVPRGSTVLSLQLRPSAVVRRGCTSPDEKEKPLSIGKVSVVAKNALQHRPSPKS